jgi:hypothetical protein
MINKSIILNEVEQELCETIAKRRHDNNRSNSVKNSKIGKQSDWETDLEGIASELAFCRLFNLYPDLTIFTRTSAQDAGDVTLPDGRTVDVKSTKYKNGKLLAVLWKSAKVDLYALMVGTFPEYTFKGFMSSSELLQPSKVKNLGYGDTYAAEQEELVELSDVKVVEKQESTTRRFRRVL